MTSYAYLRSTPIAPQPEKSEQKTAGYVFDIKKYAIHDGPGIRTTVFFKGCPLQCRWCHNPESWSKYPEPGFRGGRCMRCGRCVEACQAQAISSSDNGPVTDASECSLCGECVGACLSSAREIIGSEMTVGEILRELEKDIIFYDQSGGGVTFSGGEPLMQPEFLLALLKNCQATGMHTAVDTTCYAESEIVKKVAEQTDLFLCDLKHMDRDVHKDFTGVDNDLILYNIRCLSDVGKRIVIRMPIVPGFNDDRANIEKTAEFVRSLGNVSEIGILPYNSGGNEKATRLTSRLNLTKAEVPDSGKMTKIADTLRDSGFDVKIGG